MNLENNLPIGAEEWREIVAMHSVKSPYTTQDVASFQRKYAGLRRVNCPIGDPSCPLNVCRAKHISAQIGERADVGKGNEEYDLENNAFVSIDDKDDMDKTPPLVQGQRTPPPVVTREIASCSTTPTPTHTASRRTRKFPSINPSTNATRCRIKKIYVPTKD